MLAAEKQTDADNSHRTQWRGCSSEQTLGFQATIEEDCIHFDPPLPTPNKIIMKRYDETYKSTLKYTVLALHFQM